MDISRSLNVIRLSDWTLQVELLTETLKSVLPWILLCLFDPVGAITDSLWLARVTTSSLTSRVVTVAILCNETCSLHICWGLNVITKSPVTIGVVLLQVSICWMGRFIRWERKVMPSSKSKARRLWTYYWMEWKIPNLGSKPPNRAFGLLERISVQ